VAKSWEYFRDFVAAVAESLNHVVVVALAFDCMWECLLRLLPPDYVACILCVWEKFRDFVAAVAGSCHVSCGFGLCKCGNISLILLRLLPDHVM